MDVEHRKLASEWPRSVGRLDVAFSVPSATIITNRDLDLVGRFQTTYGALRDFSRVAELLSIQLTRLRASLELRAQNWSVGWTFATLQDLHVNTDRWFEGSRREENVYRNSYSKKSGPIRFAHDGHLSILGSTVFWGHFGQPPVYFTLSLYRGWLLIGLSKISFLVDFDDLRDAIMEHRGHQVDELIPNGTVTNIPLGDIYRLLHLSVEVGDREEALLVIKAADIQNRCWSKQKWTPLVGRSFKGTSQYGGESTDTRASGIYCPGCIRVAHWSSTN